MHFNLRRAVAVVATPLLGGALAVGATALPAAAATWQDTALVASHVVQPAPLTTHGAVVKGVVGPLHHVVVFNAPPGEEFVLVPAPTFTQGTPGTDVTLTASAHQLVLTSGLVKTGSGTLVFSIKSASPAITYTARETVVVAETGGDLAVSSVMSVPSETVAVSVFNSNVTGAVTFIGALTPPLSGPVTFSQENLPAGLASGNPLVPGTAVPRLYTGVIYTATDALGSTFSGTFWLHVFGHEVVPPPAPGNYGDMVNPFGNGFDVFHQHQFAGAIIAGWTASKADPATHFIRLHGTVPGAWKFEYAPHGAGTGLCVADPGGGWASDPLPDGLILTASNNGPFQQFYQLPNGTLKNVATGLIVNPNGTGQQLRGSVAPTPWGGSVYTWTDFAHLPG